MPGSAGLGSTAIAAPRAATIDYTLVDKAWCVLIFVPFWSSSLRAFLQAHLSDELCEHGIGPMPCSHEMRMQKRVQGRNSTKR
eukprot:7549286-Pyramimonas_sp.AAC.1